MALVAVYGTLRAGYENHERYLGSRRYRIPVLESFVEIPYRMYHNGEYPMLTPSEERHPIYIEVFDVDGGTIAKIDELEKPYNYRRESVFIAELGRDAAIYVHHDSPPHGFELVPDGRWEPGWK